MGKTKSVRINKTSGSALTLSEKKEILERYLLGESKESISESYEISPIFIEMIAQGMPVTRTQIEKNKFTLPVARENARIALIKDKLITLVDKAIDEGMTAKNKTQFINKFRGLWESLDKTQRLNEEKPTDISLNRNVNFDVHKVMKELQTPEQRRQFLLDQVAQPSDSNAH